MLHGTIVINKANDTVGIADIANLWFVQPHVAWLAISRCRPESMWQHNLPSKNPILSTLVTADNAVAGWQFHFRRT